LEITATLDPRVRDALWMFGCPSVRCPVGVSKKRHWLEFFIIDQKICRQIRKKIVKKLCKFKDSLKLPKKYS
jgi:hypothetical protein